ncbi:hypothetical protein ACIA8K_24320 [Catenuloplanes sp. NPDC051500]|uniref:hypothetical protein n=1 Tax=Catenuloplanes sp. NPDC051500 TaxID=3363959 RepID=UPI00379977A6
MNGALDLAIIIASLAVAAWAGFAGFRDRAPDRVQFIGLIVLQVGVLAMGVVSGVALLQGARPAEIETFAGYVVTTVCWPAVAFVLGRMEPTKWGSVTIAVGCLVIPVLVLRLEQIWG